MCTIYGMLDETNITASIIIVTIMEAVSTSETSINIYRALHSTTSQKTAVFIKCINFILPTLWRVAGISLNSGEYCTYIVGGHVNILIFLEQLRKPTKSSNDCVSDSIVDLRVIRFMNREKSLST
jgi:mannose/fructose/N-acetylgalactosamine-specific phosphotransferase system component IID